MYRYCCAVIAITAALLSACSDSTGPKQTPPPPQLSPFAGKWVAQTLNGRALPVVVDSTRMLFTDPWYYTTLLERDFIVLQNGTAFWQDSLVSGEGASAYVWKGNPVLVSWTADDSLMQAMVQSPYDASEWSPEQFTLRNDGLLVGGNAVFRHDTATIY
jgi:hypothetical protein